MQNLRPSQLPTTAPAKVNNGSVNTTALKLSPKNPPDVLAKNNSVNIEITAGDTPTATPATIPTARPIIPPRKKKKTSNHSYPLFHEMIKPSACNQKTLKPPLHH